MARRMFALFALAGLIPLALSDWVSIAAIGQIAEQLSLRSRAESTRLTSRQVLDHLQTSRTLLAAMPASLPGRHSGSATADLPGFGRVFRRLAYVTPDGLTAWSSDGATDLQRDWVAARPPAAASDPRVGPAPDDGAARLRVLVAPGRTARVLVVAGRRDHARWFAELDPDYLWAPLANAAEDSDWRVTDDRGRTFARHRGSDFEPAPSGRPDAHASTTILARESRLFLGAEFGADDWIFTQRAVRPVVHWQGARLTVWLALVAGATLLAIALVSRAQIRRALVPLERLTEGARRFAAGATGTRVAIRRDDEIGELAGAFNDMAWHIEAQLDALQGLAAIDHDILAGAAIDQVADRVLTRLAALYPGAGVVLSWLEGHDRLRQSRLDWPPSSPDARATRREKRVTVLTAAQKDAFVALEGDETSAPRERPDSELHLAAPPWLPGDPAPELTRRVQLPLREHGGTQALLVLGLPPALAAGSLQPARELRDRLAVAFATRAREQELVHRAVHDSLTGLTNRNGLHDQLDALLDARPRLERLAVLFVDLDRFKDVNDSRGHGAGDDVLRLASERLRACVTADSVVARHGGDEFVIVLPGADAAAARAVADEALRSLARPFALPDSEHVVGASAGIALGPDHGWTRAELLRCADIALYAAKEAGRGRHLTFTAAMDASAKDRVQLQAELRLALERGEFVVHYQPRVRPEDGAIASAEALIRWQHPVRGLLYPNDFIAVAESSGLIAALGAWVLDAACRQVAAWRRQRVRIERISVNVSPNQLASGELPATVRATLDRHLLPATALELEVTESVLMSDVRSACAQLAQLRSWGVTIALDDFGTGYSSMSVLRQLPIDVMKIDRSFVTDLGFDSGAMAVTRAIIALATSMRMSLVAEGVETEAQATLLRSLGCQELQGYLYSKPVAAERFVKLPGLAFGNDAGAEPHDLDPSDSVLVGALAERAG